MLLGGIQDSGILIQRIQLKADRRLKEKQDEGSGHHRPETALRRLVHPTQQRPLQGLHFQYCPSGIAVANIYRMGKRHYLCGGADPVSRTN